MRALSDVRAQRSSASPVGDSDAVSTKSVLAVYRADVDHRRERDHNYRFLLMDRTFFAGGWYADVLPDGEFVVLFPNNRLLTNAGPVSFPPGEPWGIGYVRCTNVGGFRFAGQAHSTLNPAAYEWSAITGWVSYLPPCVGVSPVIYDLNGRLHRSDGAVGSQGYRYVTPQNTIVSGDQSYGPFYGLFEYTSLDDSLWIGQGATDGSGVRVWDGSVLRQLELGDGRFVRATRDGDRVAIAFVRSDGAVLIQTTMAELRALPVVGMTPAPSPSPSPSPTPEPIPMNHLATVQRIRATYPTPLGARHWEFLVEVCQATGARLFRKDGGDHCWVPPLNRFVSLDVIGRGALGDVWVDILGDAEGLAVAAWDAHQGAGGEFLDVSGIVLPGHAPAPSPIPDPSPTPAPTPAPAPPQSHPSYDAMMALVRDCNGAYGREMPAATTAHLVWRFLLEAFPVEVLMADARQRGRGL